MVGRTGAYAAVISCLGAARFNGKPVDFCPIIRRRSHHLDFAAADSRIVHLGEEQKRKEAEDKAKGVEEKASIKELLTNKANLRAMILLIGIYAFWNLVAGTMGYFMPYIYETVGGANSGTSQPAAGIFMDFDCGVHILRLYPSRR